MAKNNNVLTVRLSEDVLSKMEELMELEKTEASRIGIISSSRKEIVELAIRDLYYKRINQSQDSDVVDRINGIIDDQVRAVLNSFQNKIDEILFLSIKNDLGNKVLYRSPSVLPPPASIDQAMDILLNEESGWNNALEEIGNLRWKKEKEHRHIR